MLRLRFKTLSGLDYAVVYIHNCSKHSWAALAQQKVGEMNSFERYFFTQYIMDKKEDGTYYYPGVAKMYEGWCAAQHSMHLTAIAVGGLAFLAGFGICWLWLVR